MSSKPTNLEKLESGHPKLTEAINLPRSTKIDKFSAIASVLDTSSITKHLISVTTELLMSVLLKMQVSQYTFSKIVYIFLQIY